jgi:hypothetical protein
MRRYLGRSELSKLTGPFFCIRLQPAARVVLALNRERESTARKDLYYQDQVSITFIGQLTSVCH